MSYSKLKIVSNFFSLIHQSILKTYYNSIIIEIREFQFSRYPPYVSNINEFRWKPLIIAELLTQHNSLWWMDSSVVVNKSLSYFYSNIRNTNCSQNSCINTDYPWLMITNSHHSIYAATDKRMYRYLPISDTVAKNLTMGAATVQLIYATTKIRKDVLRYWVLCALEKDCMAPEGSRLECNFGQNRYTYYAGCHRQDQSAISIILSNVNKFRTEKFIRDADDVLFVERGKF